MNLGLDVLWGESLAVAEAHLCDTVNKSCRDEFLQCCSTSTSAAVVMAEDFSRCFCLPRSSRHEVKPLGQMDSRYIETWQLWADLYVRVTSEFLDKPDKGAFVVLEARHICHVWTDESTWRVHEDGQNNIRTETNQLPVVFTLSSLIISFQTWQFPAYVIMWRGSAWERLSLGRGSSLNEGTSLHVSEELHPSKPYTILCTS